jgi:hypothetical protein
MVDTQLPLHSSLGAIFCFGLRGETHQWPQQMISFPPNCSIFTIMMINGEQVTAD